MAGDLGSLSFSLEIKSKIDQQLARYEKEMENVEKRMAKLQRQISEFDTSAVRKAKKDLDDFMNSSAKGNNIDSYLKQQDELKRLKQAYIDAQKPMADKVKRYSELIEKSERYAAAIKKVQSIQERVDRGGIVNQRSFTTLLDESGLRNKIANLARVKAILEEIQAVSMAHTPGSKQHDYSARLEKLRTELASLGGAGMSINQVDSQLQGLNNTLNQFSAANERAKNYVEQASHAEQNRIRAINDARIAFEPLVAAQQRQENQEKANRANIEATRTARQHSVEMLRREAEAMMNSRIEALKLQKAQLGNIYSKGKQMGLGSSELETILNRYREISRELLNMRSMMQNPSALGYGTMFSSGRFTGPGAGYVSEGYKALQEATRQAEELRLRTLQTAQAADSLASAFSKVQDGASRVRGIVSDLKSLFLQGGIVFGAQQFFNAVVKTGGDIVMQHVALRTILGDIKEADALFAQIQQLALQSPFTFPELNKDVKQLAAFGVEADNLYDRTRRLADIASGLGVSFERLGLAYGQVKARSWLDGKELRQFAYAGLPLLQKLAEYYNETGRAGKHDYTTSQVRTMITKREVSFEDVDTIIQRLTNEGGQFYNMQFNLSETLYGRWNKLLDAWTIMLGKFAEGKSITGSLFTAAINQATEFVLALDRISPMLLSFGAVFAGRKLFNAGLSALGINTGLTMSQMAQAQALSMKTYAATQLRAAAEGRITAEEAKQNILTRQELVTSMQGKSLAYARLFAEGKISAAQLGELLRRKQISVEMIEQLATMGLISMEQKKLILTTGRNLSQWKQMVATMKLSAGSMMGGVKALFSPANLAMMGVTAGVSLWMSYKAWSDKIEQNVQNAVDSAKQGLKALEEGIANAEKSGPTEMAVQNMKEILENSNLYTTSMQAQVEHATTLEGKYNAMLKSMKEMKGLSEHNPLIDDASDIIKASSEGFFPKKTRLGASFWEMVNMDYREGFMGFLFNDDITQNASQYSSAESEYQNALGLVKQYERDVNDEMSKLKGKYPWTYKQMQGKSFEDQLEVLAQSDAWNEIIRQIEKGDKAFRGLADTWLQKSQAVADAWYEIAYDDVPKMANKMASSRNMDLDEFKEYCRKHPELAGAAMKQLVAAMNVGNAELEVKLINTLLDYFGIVGQNVAGKTPTPDGLTDQQRVLDKASNHKLTDAELKSLAPEGGTYSNIASTLKKNYKEAKENLDAATNAGATEAEIQALKEVENKWRTAAAGFGVDLSEKKNGSDANAAANKSDNLAFKNLQARLSLIEGAYSMYKQYYDAYHNESAAIEKVRKAYDGQGLSNDDLSHITSLDGLRSLIDDYISRVRGYSLKNPENQSRKDELLAQGVKKGQDIDFKVLSEGIKEFSSATSETLKNLQRTWKTYHNVLQSTGSAGLAGSLSGISGEHPLYSGYLAQYIESLLPGSLDMNKLKGMSDKDIEDYAGTLFAGSDPTRIEGIVSALKALREQITSTEFEEGVKTFTELISKIATPKAVSDRVDAKYNDRASIIKSLGLDSDLERQLLDIANTERNASILKGSNDYTRFMNGAPVIGSTVADRVKNQAIANLNNQYSQGTITEEDYVKQLVDVGNKMLDVDTRLSGMSLFFSSGLDAVYERMISEGAYKAAAGRAANAKEPGSGDALIQEGNNLMAQGFQGKGFVAETAKLSSTIHGAVEAFQSLATALQPVVDLASALGNVGIAEGVSIGGNALNAGLSTFDSVNKLGDVAGAAGLKGVQSLLGKAGPYAAAAGAALSVVSSIFGGKSSSMKAYEKQAEYLKDIDETTSEINDSLKESIKSSSGSEAITAARKTIANNKAMADEYRKTYLSWSNAKVHKGGHRNRMKTNLDYDMLNEWLIANGYSDGGAYVGSQEIQNLSGQVLKEFRDTHAEAWAGMNDDAREYLNNIIKIEAEGGELEDTVNELVKALAGFDSETLVEDWATLLEDLTSQTDDFADNLEETLRNAIINSMVGNLFQNQIDALTKKASQYGQNMLYIAKDGTVKAHYKKDSSGNFTYDESDIASEYTKSEYNELINATDKLSSEMTDVRDMLKDTYGWSTGSSSSMTSSIQGMTEQTGDLLASYINAIRADLSILRQQDGIYTPEMSALAQSQLQQLNMISSNTLRNAEAAERMEQSVSGLYDIFNRARNGHDTISVKVS